MELLPSLVVVRDCQALRTHRNACEATLKQRLQLAARPPEEAELARRHCVQVPCRPTEGEARPDAMKLGWRWSGPSKVLARQDRADVEEGVVVPREVDGGMRAFEERFEPLDQAYEQMRDGSTLSWEARKAGEHK